MGAAYLVWNNKRPLRWSDATMRVLGSVAAVAANHRPSSGKAAAGKGASKALEQKVEALTRAVRTIESRQVSYECLHNKMLCP